MESRAQRDVGCIRHFIAVSTARKGTGPLAKLHKFRKRSDLLHARGLQKAFSAGALAKLKFRKSSTVARDPAIKSQDDGLPKHAFVEPVIPWLARSACRPPPSCCDLIAASIALKGFVARPCDQVAG